MSAMFARLVVKVGYQKGRHAINVLNKDVNNLSNKFFKKFIKYK